VVTAAAGALRFLLLLALIPAFGLPGAGLGLGLSVAAEHLVLVGCAARVLDLTPRRLLAGRPAGAEADLLALLRRVVGRAILLRRRGVAARG